MKEYTTVKEQVEFGLDSISEDAKIEVSLRDLYFVNQVIGEFIRFFHQPMHYPKLENVGEFLGTIDEGAFLLLHQCYYEKLYNVWPGEVLQMIDESIFDNPKPPFYYKPTDESQYPDERK